MTSTVIHRESTPDGTIEVIQKGRMRFLYFGSAALQSCLDLDAPYRLLLPYTQRMMVGLLFREDPRRALLIGLGGGVQVQFLLSYFPLCQLEIVESSPHVVEVARQYFHLPDSDPRVAVHLVEAEEFVPPFQAGSANGYDLILMDAYRGEGPAPVMRSREHLTRYRAHLGEYGVLGTNLWSNKRGEVRQALCAMQASLGTPILRLDVPARANITAFGRIPPFPFNEEALQGLEDRARMLQASTGLDFLTYLRSLRQLVPPTYLHPWLGPGSKTPLR